MKRFNNLLKRTRAVRQETEGEVTRGGDVTRGAVGEATGREVTRGEGGGAEVTRGAAGEATGGEGTREGGEVTRAAAEATGGEGTREGSEVARGAAGGEVREVSRCGEAKRRRGGEVTNVSEDQARDEEGLLSGEESDQDQDGSPQKEGEEKDQCDQDGSGEDQGEEMDQASEIQALRRQVNELQLEKEAGWLSNLKAESVKGDDVRCRELTGLSWSAFESLRSYLMPFMEASRSQQLSQEDQLFIVLLKLRLNPSCSLLSHTLNMGKTTLRDMFHRWIDLLYAKIKFLIHWPDRECIHATTPPAMKVLFPKLTCIVDCFEIRIESSKNLKAR